jgi:hypothetical protein
MAVELDGYAVLRRIGKKPEAFPALALDTKKAARALVLKQLKAKAADVARLRTVRTALKPEAFDLVVDGLSDAEAKVLVAKFDKHHPQIKMLDAPARRAHLRALADGSAEPTAKPKAVPKAKAAKRPAAPPEPSKVEEPPKRLASLAMAAVRQRK